MKYSANSNTASNRRDEVSEKEVSSVSQINIAYKLAAPPAVEIRYKPQRQRLREGLVTASLGWLFPALLLILWSLAATRGWAPPQLLPAPRVVGETLIEQVRSGDLFVNLGISLARVAGGFALGSIVGLALGVVMGLSRTVESYLYPTFKAVSQVPVLGWLPLAMMVLGIGEALKVVLIAHACLVPIALNTLKGIRSVPKGYVDVARAFRFSHAQLLRRVIFPATVPSIFVGVRYGLTAAWLSLVTVELLASSEGLGFLIVWGRQLFQLDLVLAAIVMVGLTGLLLDKGLATIEARLLRWRPEGL
jgi:sulfonate transport system permease protein